MQRSEGRYLSPQSTTSRCLTNFYTGSGKVYSRPEFLYFSIPVQRYRNCNSLICAWSLTRVFYIREAYGRGTFWFGRFSNFTVCFSVHPFYVQIFICTSDTINTGDFSISTPFLSFFRTLFLFPSFLHLDVSRKGEMRSIRILYRSSR